MTSDMVLYRVNTGDGLKVKGVEAKKISADMVMLPIAVYNEEGSMKGYYEYMYTDKDGKEWLILDDETLKEYVHQTQSDDGIEVEKSDKEELLYISSNTYNGFNIGINKNHKLLLYKEVDEIKNIYAEMLIYISESNLLNNEYVKKYGLGFYADWNNSNSNHIRIDKENDRIWYEFDSEGTLISKNAYRNGEIIDEVYLVSRQDVIDKIQEYLNENYKNAKFVEYNTLQIGYNDQNTRELSPATPPISFSAKFEIEENGEKGTVFGYGSMVKDNTTEEYRVVMVLPSLQGGL